MTVPDLGEYRMRARAAGSLHAVTLRVLLPELAGWLFRENDFPQGAYLMTGTGIVPPATFTLQPGDAVRIEIDGVGALENAVE